MQPEGMTTISSSLRALLEELEQFGRENDARETEHSRKMLNITRDTGEFLLLLIRAMRARRILEIGTSNGYSTLWLAHAVEPLGGSVVTVEKSSYKAGLARDNFKRAQMDQLIHLRETDAGDYIQASPAGAFDFMFLDAARREYVGWWPELQRVLGPGGLLVVDNAVSHAQELKPFRRVVLQTPGYVTSLVPVGNGQALILKPAD